MGGVVLLVLVLLAVAAFVVVRRRSKRAALEREPEPGSHGGDPAAEYATVQESLSAVAAELAAKGAKAGGEAQAVLEAASMMAQDPTLTDDVKAGIVVATLGYWRQLNEGTVNSISAGAFTDMGHAPSFSDNLVEVSRAN